jgi:hypothetical protein
MGAGQFGRVGQEWHRRFFNHPERMSEMFGHFCRLGYPGAHVTGYPTIVEAARMTKESHNFKVAISLLPENWEENLKEVLVLDPEVVFVHGAMTDRFLDKRLDDLKECFDTIRTANSFPGLATHDTCHTLTVLQSEENPLQGESFGLLLPINRTGYSIGGTPTEIFWNVSMSNSSDVHFQLQYTHNGLVSSWLSHSQQHYDGHLYPTAWKLERETQIVDL